MVRRNNGLKNKRQLRLTLRKMESDSLRPKVNFFKKKYSDFKKSYPVHYRLNPKESKFSSGYLNDLFYARRFLKNNSEKVSLNYLKFLETMNNKYKIYTFEIPKDLSAFGDSRKNFLDYFNKTYVVFNKKHVMSLEEKVIFKLFNSTLKKDYEVFNEFSNLSKKIKEVKELNKSKKIDFNKQREKIISDAEKELKHSFSLERISSKEEKYQLERQKSIIEYRDQQLKELDKMKKEQNKGVRDIKKERKELNEKLSKDVVELYARMKVIEHLFHKN